jgi:hypothetical protein
MAVNQSEWMMALPFHEGIAKGRALPCCHRPNVVADSLHGPGFS